MMMMEKPAPEDEPLKKTDDTQYVTEVRAHDVLLGRGAGPNEHSGNVKFRLLVAKQKKQYMDTTNRQVKNKIAHKTIRIIKSQKGRFLQKVKGSDEDVYVVADDRIVLEKTKQALRHVDRVKKDKKQVLKDETSIASPGEAPESTAPLNVTRDSLLAFDQLAPSRNLREVYSDGRIGSNPMSFAQRQAPIMNSAALAMQANLAAGLNLENQTNVAAGVHNAQHQLGLFQRHIDGVLSGLPDTQLASSLLHLDASDYARAATLNSAMSAQHHLATPGNSLLQQTGQAYLSGLKQNNFNALLLGNHSRDTRASPIDVLVAQLLGGRTSNILPRASLHGALPGNASISNDALSQSILSEREREAIERIQKMQYKKP